MTEYERSVNFNDDYEEAKIFEQFLTGNGYDAEIKVDLLGYDDDLTGAVFVDVFIDESEIDSIQDDICEFYAINEDLFGEMFW